MIEKEMARLKIKIYLKTALALTITFPIWSWVVVITWPLIGMAVVFSKAGSLLENLSENFGGFALKLQRFVFKNTILILNQKLSRKLGLDGDVKSFRKYRNKKAVEKYWERKGH